jgi:subtilisin
VDLSAPGVSIRSSYLTSDQHYHVASGTSVAAPHVAGIAALWLEKHPEMSGAELWNTLVSTAQPLPNGQPVDIGVGLVSSA